MTLRCGSIVTTYRAVQIASTDVSCDAQETSVIAIAGSTNVLKVGSIEGPRQQIFEAQRFSLAARVKQHHLDIPAEFPQNLPARAAGRRESIGVGRDGDASKIPRAFGDGFEHRYA